MRYVFIVNPKTHAGQMLDEIKSNIKRILQDETYIIIESQYKGHITKIAQHEAKQPGKLRIYGFGGDGTLNEIVRGVIGYDHVEVGIFPVGSGNDYVRYFGDKRMFLDYEKQIFASSKPVDIIKTDNGYAINICSVGFDAKVGYLMSNYKNLPFVSGPMSYDIAVFRCLMGQRGENLQISIDKEDGKVNYKGKYLFVLGACGQYYGGGYKGAPLSINDDGLLDFVLVKQIPLLKMLKLLPLYKKGLHLSDPMFNGYVDFVRGTQIEIQGDKDFYCNLDGECERTASSTFSLCQDKISFILPNS